MFCLNTPHVKESSFQNSWNRWETRPFFGPLHSRTQPSTFSGILKHNFMRSLTYREQVLNCFACTVGIWIANWFSIQIKEIWCFAFQMLCTMVVWCSNPHLVDGLVLITPFEYLTMIPGIWIAIHLNIKQVKVWAGNPAFEGSSYLFHISKCWSLKKIFLVI